VSDILKARSLDVETVAAETDIPQARLRQFLRHEADLEEDEVLSLADELGVPIQALFASQPPSLAETVDFRLATPRPNRPSRGVLKAYRFIEKLSSTLSSTGHALRLDPEAVEAGHNFDLAEAPRIARKWREKWGLKIEDQLEFRDPNKLYSSLRTYVESLGAYVVHFSFRERETSGFYTRVGDGPHVIAINTTGSSKARKCFTLAHEFGHLLTRQEGVSNPSVVRNRVERFCNKFAAVLLAPSRLVRMAWEFYEGRTIAVAEAVRLLAHRMSLSLEATFLRLVELHIASQSEYDAWKSGFAGPVPDPDASDGQGGGGGDPLVAKRTQYGKSLLSSLARAAADKSLDDIEIYWLTGLKPKYQRPLFIGAAGGARPETEIGV
jgi:Zn-dependent peptidase ImmA (M78 family)